MNKYDFLKTGFCNLKQQSEPTNELCILLLTFLSKCVKTAASIAFWEDTQHSISREHMLKSMMYHAKNFASENDTSLESNFEEVKGLCQDAQSESSSSEEEDCDHFEVMDMCSKQIREIVLDNQHDSDYFIDKKKYDEICNVCECWAEWHPSDHMRQFLKKHIDSIITNSEDL